MKKVIFACMVIVVVLGAGVVPAYAHGGGGGFHGSIWIGPGWWWGQPYYPYYPYYYYPYYPQPPVVRQQAPVYEYEQQPSQQQEYYWYFCPEADAYYPYVKQCPGGWKKVVPTPPDKGRER
jgi:hypothetical protein